MNRTRLFALVAVSALFGCSSEDSSPGPETQVGALTKTQVVVEDLGKAPLSIYSFDLASDSAGATVTSLGMDVQIDFDGRFELRPTLSVNASPRPDWSYTLDPVKIGREEVQPLLAVESVERAGDTLRIKHRGAAEVLWQHRVDGVEQHIKLANRPAGKGSLRVVMSGNRDFEHQLSDDGESVIVEHDGKYLFRWSKLHVVDASGAEVPAHFSVKPNEFSYEIDDRKAVYPLLIDPIAGVPAWTVVGTEVNTRFGYDVSGIGDVNNDNFDDVVVGQSRYTNGESREGRLLVYLGSAAGLPATASWTFESNQASAGIGTTVSTAGNVNNDNFADLIAGAPGETAGGLSLAGAAYIFHGSATGLPATQNTKLLGDAANGLFGSSVADAGDVNCDGFDDVIIGSGSYGANNGRAWVHNGSATGVSSTASWTVAGTAAENFGVAVAGGNVNGDMSGGNPCSDVIVSAPGHDQPSYTNAGRIAVFHGGTTGLSTTAAFSWTPQENGVRAGDSLDSGGDFNNDGFDDVIIGAPARLDLTGTNEVGGFFVFEGSATGLGTTPDLDFRTVNVGSQAGNSVAVIGDANADGYDDVAIGAYKYSNGQAEEGIVFDLQGSPTGLITTPSFFDEINVVGAWLGWSVASAGDVNNDGLDDVIASARNYPNSGGGIVGAAFAFAGERDCYIGGDFYRAAASNPTNDCEICSPAQSTTAWTTVADGTTCDDGSLCTSGDVCGAGVCTGTPSVVCNDGNACTVDTCVPATGLCDFDSGAADGNTCTIPNQPSCTTNVCGGGSCTPTAISGCLIGGACYQSGATNPSNPCQICDPNQSQTAFVNAAQGTTCDDAQFCTVNDQCNGAGVCTGAARDCSGAADECYNSVGCSEIGDACVPTSPKPDGTACGGDLCTVAGMCTGGTCSGMTLDCSNLDTACTVGVCDPSNGACQAQPRPDGTPCDDADACTENTLCAAGTCGGGGAVNCDDMNSCTTDSCDTTAGCQYANLPDATTCDDGDACTENDACTTGMCTGAAITCDDGNECTQNTCDMALGCQFPDEADGTTCVGDGLTCTTGACMTGTCDNNLNASTCLINSTCFDDGVADPGNDCRICDSATSTDMFSPAASGTACDLSQCNADGTAVVQGACDAQGTCTSDSGMERDCGRYFCTNGACQTQCMGDDECREGNICEAGECVDAECTTNDDCGTGEECVDQRCEAQCQTDQDCEEGQVCNADNVCEDAPTDCMGDDDCDNGQVCVDGSCEDPSSDCQTNEDCDAGEICNADGQCEATTQCSEDADCGSGETCQNGACIATPKGELEGSGCGCASTGGPENTDASWMLLALIGLVGVIRRRRR